MDVKVGLSPYRLRLRLSENRLLKELFGPKREKVAGGWRKIHEELCNMHISQIIKVIKSKKM
jgi:hypothetical protein